MTIGALSLMWMETAPVDELRPALTALPGSPVSDDAVIYRTHVPVNHSKWVNVVVRKASSAEDEVAQSCHFLVSDSSQAVESTDLWKRQVDGYHTFAPGHDWNSDSIGVCFLGDLEDQVLTEQHFNELMALVQTLQHHFKVRAERVYLHSELDDRTMSPSASFIRTFSRRLLQQPSGF